MPADPDLHSFRQTDPGTLFLVSTAVVLRIPGVMIRIYFCVRAEWFMMIVSASRRTDIPACFPAWFCRRIAAGFCFVRNPYSGLLTEVSLLPEDVDVIVFWTKDAGPLCSRLSAVDACGIPYYFQYTVTPYGRDLEPGFAKERSISAFLELSDRLGPERVLWRYDPVLISDRYSPAFHAEAFSRLCELFAGRTERCTMSFADRYPGLPVRECTTAEMEEFAEFASAAAKDAGISLYTCAEEIDLRRFGILPGSCVDAALCERLAGYPLRTVRDAGQRDGCCCVESVDIGAYGSCRNGCLYCYAGGAHPSPVFHDPDSPLLLGSVRPDESAVVRRSGSLRDTQTRLFPDC